MDERDDWLEGVRRWYFGGDEPAEARDDELSWPSGDNVSRCADVARQVVAMPSRVVGVEAHSA